jgi:hypothetical protein
MESSGVSVAGRFLCWYEAILVAVLEEVSMKKTRPYTYQARSGKWKEVGSRRFLTSADALGTGTPPFASASAGEGFTADDTDENPKSSDSSESMKSQPSRPVFFHHCRPWLEGYTATTFGGMVTRSVI